MTAAHTPGPWSIIEFGGMQIGHESTGEAVCTMWGSDTDPDDPKLANARLIAAAPALLEALDDLAALICEVAPEYAESTVTANAFAVSRLAKGESA